MATSYIEGIDNTLIGRLRFPHAFAARKHGLDGNPIAYADDKINNMTNVDLVQAISDVLNEMGVITNA